jgi:hypothetical protein
MRGSTPSALIHNLGAAWILASKTGGIAPVVGEDGKP